MFIVFFLVQNSLENKVIKLSKKKVRDTLTDPKKVYQLGRCVPLRGVPVRALCST
jgi:hypothetical protein